MRDALNNGKVLPPFSSFGIEEASCDYCGHKYMNYPEHPECHCIFCTCSYNNRSVNK